MKDKIRTAFIFHKDNPFLKGTHFDNTYYNFFFKGLKRNDSLDVTYFPTGQSFDASVLKNNFDVILLWSNYEWGMPKELENITKLDIPVIARAADPGNAKKTIKNHKDWKIDYYFHFLNESFFYDLYPSHFKYKTIVYGIEPSLFENVMPFEKRIKRQILNSGAIGSTKFISKMINNIRNPKWNALTCYKLRTKCVELPYVDYTPTLNHDYINDRYPLLLQKYAAAIAANSNNPNMKYWEIAASGCLTFMEITKKNKGEFLGYKDGKHAIFINEDNYKEKFQEYLDDPENSRWEKIAELGREYTIKNFNNDVATSSLVKLIKSLLV